MKIIKYLDVEPTQEASGVAKREVITADDGAPNFCMRVFDIRSGCSTPSHSHEWEHEIFILTGQGVVVGEQGATPIARENVVFIPANETHCIVNTGNEPLRFICLVPLPK